MKCAQMKLTDMQAVRALKETFGMLGGEGAATTPRKRAPPVKDRTAEETWSLGHPVRTSEAGQNPPPHRPLPLHPGELAASAAGASLQGTGWARASLAAHPGGRLCTAGSSSPASLGGVKIPCFHFIFKTRKQPGLGGRG